MTFYRDAEHNPHLRCDLCQTEITEAQANDDGGLVEKGHLMEVTHYHYKCWELAGYKLPPDLNWMVGE